MNMAEVFTRWGKYTQEIERFAVYPEAGTGSQLALAYCALGLVDEWFEFEQAKEAYLGEEEVGTVASTTLHNFRAELGDLLWYTGRLETELEAVQEGVVHLTTMRWAQRPASWAVVTESAHAITGRVKKLLRGDEQPFQLQSVANLLIQLRNEILGDSELAVEAMDYNVKKLSSRLERGVIRGDGDNR